MNTFWQQLRPYIQTMTSYAYSSSVEVHVRAPAQLLMRLGRFYKYELEPDANLIDGAQNEIYANAWYTIDVGFAEELRKATPETDAR